jgi:hypothetical protein
MRHQEINRRRQGAERAHSICGSGHFTMAQQSITCRRCPTYDREARRCRIGKTNPKTKHESLTVAELFGPQALCLHNPHREPLLLRMRCPERRFVWTEPIPRILEMPLEIEILEEEIEG